MQNSQTLKDLKRLYEDKLFQLDLNIKYLGISQTEIDRQLDQINYLKSQIEQIEKEN